jgi:hypothetical protein
VSLLRISASDQSSAVCAKCHIEAEQLKTSMHSPDHVGTQDARAQACAPCHRVHATEGMGRNRLWATTMFEKGKDASERYCLGCHSAGGGAAAPAVFSHPETNMKDVKAATAQPSALIDQFGKISQITCSTCHMAHGCDMPKPASDPADIASMKTMLRPNVASEVCAACHGIDGARRFLYFHDPKKRTAVTTADSPH